MSTVSPAWRGRILVPGRNCWTVASAHAAGLLVDARNYYRAFYRAARSARHYILLAGWRFNSDIRLLRGADAHEVGGDVRLVPFLQELCAGNSELQIFVLAWDFSINYALDWELFQDWKFRTPSGKQLHFLFDGQHAVAGSHHQKFVVVDGMVAFVGGLDFCADDWDDRRHLAHDPERADSGKEPHPPYHDIQACVTGPVAEELKDYFRRRWHAAGGTELHLPRVSDPAPAVEVSLALPSGPVALSRTEPQTLADPECVQEIRQVYLDAIAAAERLIYVENQYFSADAVAQALLVRMRQTDRPRLELVIVLPKEAHSWVEAAATGPPRIRILDALRETAEQTGHRLGVYYTTAQAEDGTEVPVLIHSKMMIVDDRFLTIGSANLSNRSLGVDTELNMTWEAPDEGGENWIDAIRNVRIDLLAEHTGLSEEGRQALGRIGGLVEYLDGLARNRQGRLRLMSREAFFGDRNWLRAMHRWGWYYDPERPVIDEMLNEAMPGPHLMAWFREWFVSERYEPRTK